MRTYTLYRSSPGADFTNRVADYYSAPPGSRCRYRVRAKSIKQAYFLAGNGIWAEDPDSVGLIERQVGGKHQPVERASHLEEREAEVG